MNCYHAQALFSARLDGDESPDAIDLDRHLQACPSCREAYARFSAGAGVLRRWTPAPIPEAEVSSILELTVPHLPHEKTRRGRPLLTHAAALLLGGTLVGWERSAHLAEPAPLAESKVVTRIVEVPVEIPIERRVEIPIEVPVEVPVEVFVDVPREVVVERIVTRDRFVPHPLQARHDVEGRLIASLAEIGASALALSNAMFERVDLGPPMSPGQTPAAIASTARRPKALRVGSERTALPEPALEVLRDGDRVTLRTSGSIQQVVPALLGTLDGPDTAVASSALAQLERIRSGLGDRAVPLSASRGERPDDDAPGGIRALWRASNDRRSGSERVGIRSDSIPVEAWRDWWARQRESLGLAARATTY